MMEVDYADVAIVCNHEDRPIKLDSNQLAALRHVYCVVKESGSGKKSVQRGQRANPAQCSISIENDR